MTHSPCLTDCPICILQVTTAQAVEHHGPERLTPDLATILQGGVPAHLSDVQIAANKLVCTRATAQLSLGQAAVHSVSDVVQVSVIWRRKEFN